MFENRKRQKELELKADIADIKLDHLPAEIREAFANDYVETIRKGKLIYSRDFYKAMLKHIQSGMTYVEAYKACGFNVDALGTDRANAAGKRAVAMDRDDKLAYFQARCMYLEAELEYEKEKKRLAYQEALSRSKKMKKQK